MNWFRIPKNNRLTSLSKNQWRRKWNQEREEKEAGLNNEDRVAAVIWPAVCELWCQISGTGLLLPPQETQMITHTHTDFHENMMEHVSCLKKQLWFKETIWCFYITKCIRFYVHVLLIMFGIFISSPTLWSELSWTRQCISILLFMVYCCASTIISKKNIQVKLINC